MLDIVRVFHRWAREAFAKSDVATGTAAMKDALRAGKRAAPYIRNAELRRILSNEPMAEEEWERFCGPPIS
jgi:hypothetical protein